jgi:hypothetical protein
MGIKARPFFLLIEPSHDFIIVKLFNCLFFFAFLFADLDPQPGLIIDQFFVSFKDIEDLRATIGRIDKVKAPFWVVDLSIVVRPIIAYFGPDFPDPADLSFLHGTLMARKIVRPVFPFCEFGVYFRGRNFEVFGHSFELHSGKLNVGFPAAIPAFCAIDLLSYIFYQREIFAVGIKISVSKQEIINEIFNRVSLKKFFNFFWAFNKHLI